LTRAMKELPAGYRTIFVLHEVRGYEHHEIARLLHCSVGNSKSQLHKAKTRMRELLGLEESYAARVAKSRAAESVRSEALSPNAMGWEPASEAA
jgi:RNA polymerase sigma-70 factor, ECF subfamily